MGRTVKVSRRWAIALGIGLALFPIHNVWLTNVTSINGQATLFLPWFGAAIWILVSLFLLRDHWREIDWGGKKITVPLLIIVASMGLSGFINGDSVGDKFSPILMGISMFALYGVTRYLVTQGISESIKTPIIAMVLLGAVIGIIVGVIAPGSQEGGLITNYCASVGFLILGGLLIPRRWLWIAFVPILLAVFLLGALEGLFILAVLAVTMLVRRDWGKRLLLPVGVMVVLIGAWTLLGNTADTYRHTIKNFVALGSISESDTEEYGGLWGAVDAALSGRWIVIKEAMCDIRVLGHGYVVTPAPAEAGDRRPVHCTPLLVVDQVGPLAGLAWLWVTVFCLVKTRWKYIWVAVLAMSVFDYYIWTQFAPYWWLLIGLSTATVASNDYIFRRGHE